MEKNRFNESWLTEREFFDHQSRSNLLTNEIKKDSKVVNNLVDLGCGTGSITAILQEKWPDANVTGVD